MKGFVLLLIAAPVVHSHYLMTIPVGRSGGNPKDPDNYDVTFWYTGKTKNEDGAVLGKNELRTEGGWYDDSAPWRAPGHAEVWSPCGMFCRGDGGGCTDGGKADGNKDGRDLPVKEKVTWQAGSVQEVGFGINTNHGGGYSWRICKANSDLSEECFGKGALEFVGDSIWVQHFDDKSRRTEIPAKRTTKGKYGSMWTMNPVPMYDCGDGCPFEEPMEGLHGQESDSDAPLLKKVNFIDKVRVPKVAPGHYVLSFRIDCEETNEVWDQCGDVEIVNDGPSPSPLTNSTLI